MATVLPHDALPYALPPAHGPAFTLPELQHLVGGDIEILRLRFTLNDRGPLYLVVNETGRLDHLPLNPFATALAQRPIVGHALVCTYTELGD